jgi:hypothetical protein
MLGLGEYKQESSDDSSVEIVGHRGSSARARNLSEMEIKKGEIETSVLSREALLRLVDSSGNLCMHLAVIGSQLNKLNKKVDQLKRLLDPDISDVQIDALEETERDAPPYSPIDYGNESPFASPRDYASP